MRDTNRCVTVNGTSPRNQPPIATPTNRLAVLMIAHFDNVREMTRHFAVLRTKLLSTWWRCTHHSEPVTLGLLIHRRSCRNTG